MTSVSPQSNWLKKSKPTKPIHDPCRVKTKRRQRQSAIYNLQVSTLFARSLNARPNCKSPRPSGGSFSTGFTAGCGKVTPFTFFATTTVNDSGSRKSGRNSSDRLPACLHLKKFLKKKLETGATPVPRCILARSPAAFFEKTPNSSSSPTPRFLAATKSNGRAD
jgi:hypothetical protein